jgi:hypothetical protein
MKYLYRYAFGVPIVLLALFLYGVSRYLGPIFMVFGGSVMLGVFDIHLQKLVNYFVALATQSPHQPPAAPMDVAVSNDPTKLATSQYIALEMPAKPEPIAPDAESLSPATEALLRAIKERRAVDPLIGAKLGSREVVERLTSAMKSDRGVHVESLLCTLGALAGYACQMSARTPNARQFQTMSNGVYTVQTKAGKTFFFGDAINQPLLESQYSVWSLAAGTAKANGCSQLLDLEEIVKHVSQSVGHDTFGSPRIPEGHQPSDSPINILKPLWPVMLPTVQMFCPSSDEWPILFGLAIQQVMDMGKSVIKPDLALLIVMESAIPMSKIDLPNW